MNKSELRELLQIQGGEDDMSARFGMMKKPCGTMFVSNLFSLELFNLWW